jgi:YggT family protein
MVIETLRFLVFALFLFSALVALANWALHTQRIDTSTALGRFLTTLTDRVLGPVENWQLRRGGNPQNAGWWLLGIAVVGGIVVLTVSEWVLGTIIGLAGAAGRGPRSLIRMIVALAGQLVLIALIVRVIASWFGAGRYNPWLRWAYYLTDWIVEPLRKVIPPLGMIDISPLVAWFLIQFLVLPLILGIL